MLFVRLPQIIMGWIRLHSGVIQMLCEVRRVLQIELLKETQTNELKELLVMPIVSQIRQLNDVKSGLEYQELKQASFC